MHTWDNVAEKYSKLILWIFLCFLGIWNRHLRRREQSLHQLGHNTTKISFDPFEFVLFLIVWGILDKGNRFRRQIIKLCKLSWIYEKQVFYMNLFFTILNSPRQRLITPNRKFFRKILREIQARILAKFLQLKKISWRISARSFKNLLSGILSKNNAQSHLQV